MPEANPPKRAGKHTRSASMRGVTLPPTPAVRSARAATIVRWFGLEEAMKRRAGAAPDAPPAPIALDLAPGTITLVTGPSGAGKSSLLRDVHRAAQRAPDGAPGAVGAPGATCWIDLASIVLPDVPVVDCFLGATAFAKPQAAGSDAQLRDTLLDLARVGLAEAWTYLRTPAELSDGQRWRLKLAIALDAARRATRADPSAGVILVADEFAALLDRVTACVVARSLRRAIAPAGASSLAALVATSHPDVIGALSPDVVVRCDFGRVTKQDAPTIFKRLSACGFADQDALETGQSARSTRVDPPSRDSTVFDPAFGSEAQARREAQTRRELVEVKRKTSNPGGPMRKIIVASLATLAVVSVARAERDNDARVNPTPRGGNDRLLLEPPSPFEPPRSLFEFDPRPTRRPIMPLYPTVERELDRGSGRIESDLEFETRRWQRERDERRGAVRRVPTGRDESERFEDERDRDLRLEQRRRRLEQVGDAQQRVETESARLAAERERFYRAAGIDVSGAAHDTRQLRSLERAYQRDVKRLRSDRAAELKRLARRDLAPDARAAARAEIERRYDAAQTGRRERYATDRARIMGN